MAEPQAAARGDFPTVIGPDASFKGELKFEKGVRLLGRIEGLVETQGQLEIAEGATLEGDVKAGHIRVDGAVKGNLRASGKIHLSASAKLEGDLTTARLEVAEGAVFIGKCAVGSDSAVKGAVTSRPDDATKHAPQPALKK